MCVGLELKLTGLQPNTDCAVNRVPQRDAQHAALAPQPHQHHHGQVEREQGGDAAQGSPRLLPRLAVRHHAKGMYIVQPMEQAR